MSVNDETKTVRLCGFVLDEGSRRHLSIDGDDGAPHHAKSGALDDFETVCESLRQGLTRKVEPTEADAPTGDNERPASQGSGGASTPAPHVTPPMQDSFRQDNGPQTQSQTPPTPQQWRPVTTNPATQQGMWPSPAYAMPQPQLQQAQVGYGWYGDPQRPQPTLVPQAWQPSMQPTAMQPPQQSPQRQQFGYGSPETMSQQDQQPNVAPGWGVQSVPNKCWAYISISCVELIFLVAESLYINYAVSIFMMLLLSWPAIPAIVLSVSYKRAFQAGNAQMAMTKMRQARGWIIGVAIWCLVRVIFKLTMCSSFG